MADVGNGTGRRVVEVPGVVILTKGHYLGCVVAAFGAGFLLCLLVFWGAIFGG